MKLGGREEGQIEHIAILFKVKQRSWSDRETGLNDVVEIIIKYLFIFVIFKIANYIRILSRATKCQDRSNIFISNCSTQLR